MLAIQLSVLKGEWDLKRPHHYLIKAHHLLEKHTLTKQQLFWKDQLSNVYGSNLHEGLFYEPLMRDLEAFLTSTQHMCREQYL